MRRFWFSFDFETAGIHRTADMVTGWTFGTTEAEAETAARAYAIKNHPRNTRLKTALINLHEDQA